MNTRLILSIFTTGIMLLPQVARAASVHYQWRYSAINGSAWGNLTAAGIDSSGHLVAISDVSMGLIGGGGECTTGYLEVENPVGWYFTEPRIRADGSSVGLDLFFLSTYLGQEAGFVMHHHSEFGGPYEGEVSFMNKNGHHHMHENLSNSINWRLWQTDAARVPDGGTTRGLSLLALFPLMAAHWVRSRRKHV